MIKVYILFVLLTIALNVLNSYYIPKCKSKMEKYMFALVPSLISTLCVMFYYIFIMIYGKDVEMLTSLNIITNISMCIIFLIVNAFVIISKGIDEKKDNDVTVGLLFIFTIPIIFFISLPLLITLFILYKIRQTKNKNVKVIEEEIFDDAVYASEYGSNEISVTDYINELKYNSNL